MAELHKSDMSQTELMARDLFKAAIVEIEQLFGVNPMVMMGIMGQAVGKRAACIDECMKDNEDVRHTLVLPGKEHTLTGTDTKDCFIKNFEFAHALHIKHHEEARAAGQKLGDELLNSVVSHTKGESNGG